MGIIRIYRSSVTHWCKFGVHMLCCSHDRAVFPIFPNKKQLHLKKSCFPTLKWDTPKFLPLLRLHVRVSDYTRWPIIDHLLYHESFPKSAVLPTEEWLQNNVHHQ